jgi:acetyltransferase-like isoleucine patch superfamily enzyme
MRSPRSHGTGAVDPSLLRACGDGVVIERGALIFHPENVSLGHRVYVGHLAILKGYFRNQLVVGEGSWIGQAAFLHAAGGITIGRDVGIGPHACIITSTHAEPDLEEEDAPSPLPAGEERAGSPRYRPIMDGALEFAPVALGDGCDIGVGAVILPGVTVGEGAQIGAGAVVTREVPAYAVVAGNPARVLRQR